MHSRKRQRRNNKPLALILSLVLLLCAAVGGVIAYLIDDTTPVVNTFTPQLVPVEIVEVFDNSVKTNVGVKNNAEIPVYVRVALTPTWEENGSPVGESASLSDLDIDWGTGWTKGKDGFYYYTSPVASGATTPNLIDRATVKDGFTHNYDMNLNVMAQSIQAAGVGSDGKAPVVSAWETGVSAVSATDGTGTLTIITG